MHYDNYESDFERFLREWKEQRPEIEEKQREGRLLFWDKRPQTPEEVKRASASDVKLKPYVYD